MTRLGVPLALAGLLLLPGATGAQEAPPERLAPGDTVSLDIQDMELPDVIGMIARFTGKNFLYDDRVRGRVTVISETPVTLEEAYSVFESILQVKGFTAVEGPGGVTKIIPVRDVKEAAIDTVTGEVARPLANRDLFITRLIPLRYVKAETIINTFRPLVSKDANLIAYAPTNTMILTDTAANIRRLMTILTEIDVETYQEQIRVFPLEFADAATLATSLQSIFTEGGQAAARTRTARARVQRTTATAQAQAAAVSDAIFGAAGEPRFITDDRTNSIIVIAPAPTLGQVERLITLLDYKRKGTGRIHVVRLQNADSEEMAQTLGALTQGAPAPVAARGAAGQAAAAAVAELEGGVRVTADAPTNSLIIQASPEGFAAVRDVIEELDVRRPQVMVEALIMEVDVEDNTTLGGGFLYQQLLQQRNDDSRITIGSNTAGDPFPTVVPGGGIADPGTFSTAILGKTVTVLDSMGNPTELPVIQAILTASADDTATNIISAPLILTADNEEAQIVIGSNIPVPTTRLSRVDEAQADQFVTSQNIERQDVGVTLRVTPQISEGDTVRLNIFQEISEVQPEADPELGPTTTNRTIENTVFVRDGESVMIGGILSDTHTDTETKVPFLGDIPLLGWLFKSVIEDTRKVNLLIVLTPHVVRDPEDLQQLTVRQREKFRSAAGDALAFGEREAEARRKALESGIPLPLDPNPVRRELDLHTERYPTETIQELRERQSQREVERREALEAVGRETGGSFRVQVSVFRRSEPAVELLGALLRAGYDGTVLAGQVGDETLYRVQLGPYPSDDQAQRVAREVRADLGLAADVLVEP